VRGLGLWGFLLVVYFGVCHRMIPFFSSRVVPGYVIWRPDWVLYLFVALGLVRGLLETRAGLGVAGERADGRDRDHLRMRWRPRARTGVRLLDVLHISLAWLAAGLALAALRDLATPSARRG
jgi:uncharacterized protein involved in response to NO